MVLNKENLVRLLNKALNQQAVFLKKDDEIAYFSPFLSHHKRKLQVNLNTGQWHCWITNKGGPNVISLLWKISAPEKLIAEVEKIVGSIKPIKIDENYKPLNLPKEFQSLIVPSKSIPYRQAKSYLKSRGITDIDIIKYNIGYCETGDYKNRIIIPSYDADGQLNFFTGRSWNPDEMFSYKNPADASKNIVGFELLVDFSETIYLVEGVFDAIAVKRNAIPLFGKTVPPLLKQRIIEYSVPEIVILLDKDALKDTIKICKDLLSDGRNVRFLKLDEKDPSKIGFENIQRLLKKSVEVDFARLLQLKLI